MTKRELIHLEWIYDRMKNVHQENPNIDYMIKFKEILESLKGSQTKATINKKDYQSEIIEEALCIIKEEQHAAKVAEEVLRLKAHMNKSWYKKVFPFRIKIERI